MEPPQKPIPESIPKGRRTEIIFLAGPRNRWLELRYLFRVAWQFFQGFRKLHFVGPCVSVFGSARFKEEHPYYQMARELKPRWWLGERRS